MASTPCNIRGSASQLFFQDKQSAEYKALCAIADIPHPDRSTLGAFISDAFDSQEAARYFLHTIGLENGSASQEKAISQFVSEWKSLVGKFRPVRATALSRETKMLIYDRDGGCCNLTRTPFTSYSDPDLVYAQIVPPLVLVGTDLSEGTSLFEMLSTFVSRESLEGYRAIFSSPRYQQSERLDNLLLLSTQAFEAVNKGEAFVTAQSWVVPSNTRQSYDIGTNSFTPDSPYSLLPGAVVIENRTPDLTPNINKELLLLHARFSKSLAWIEAERHMKMSPGNAVGSRIPFPSSFITLKLRVLRRLWVAFPSFIRAFVYDGLLWIGSRIYRPSLSMTVYKLPFGLYLRRGPLLLAPKYHVEAHTLRMVEQLTHIPAPRAIDVLKTRHFSYLLMTRVPGRPIGHIIDTMTDEQVKQAVIDLKGYISELRKIPNKTEFQICNSEGGGILDWRIPDSQREELRFRTEADFNKYLTDPFWEQIRRDAAKSHDIQHDIVFTHGDLNPRNILAEKGKITGIVDWENAGWFPEYWEYTKAHYSVRSSVRWLADVIDQIFEGHRNELIVENMLSDLLGPF